MPYVFVGDELGDDPRWVELAGGRRALRNELQATHLRMLCTSARYFQDGYLTGRQALGEADGRSRVVELLCEPELGRGPFLHRKGQRCAERGCLDDSGPWVDGFAYRLCAFSKRNPTRTEYQRSRSQRADRRDARLRQLVYDRDGGCCRYCRSGPLAKKGQQRAKESRKVIEYDHPDPDRPAGSDGENFVVACRRCNGAKGHRTPEEADQPLLSEPTPEEIATWRARGLALFDPPISNSDQPRDQRPTNEPTNEPTNGPVFGPVVGRGDGSTGQVRPQNARPTAETATDQTREGVRSGRGGDAGFGRGSGAGWQPQRSPDAPDIYHRRSRPGRPP